MSNNKLGSLKGKEEGIDDKEEENRFVNLSSIFFLFFFLEEAKQLRWENAKLMMERLWQYVPEMEESTDTDCKSA